MTSRRTFLRQTAAAGAAGILPLSVVELSFGTPKQDFTFACISDSHIQHIRGTEFVRNWDRGLIRAVTEANRLNPKPDFVFFGGDLAQLGTRAELDHGAGMLAKLDYETHMVMGEHDYYLDLGEHWSDLFGDHFYSFDHKGVHFVVLNSILTDDVWTYDRWPTGAERMNGMAGLDNPNGSPFMVGEAQRAWLAKDLAKVRKDTPLVVFSHSPLQKIYKGWNFWTEDAEAVQELLAPFDRANVLYGHVHRIQHNQIGNLSFNSVMATAWPWPYPQGHTQAGLHLPKLTVQMSRADPYFDRGTTGWQFIDVANGRVDATYRLNNDQPRTVVWNAATGRHEDLGFQDPGSRIAPQIHY